MLGSMERDFGFVSYFSMFASVLILVALIIVMGFAVNSYKWHPELHNNLRQLDIGQLPFFFGIAMFNYGINPSVNNQEAVMKNP
jgi:hypothetical protein